MVEDLQSTFYRAVNDFVVKESGLLSVNVSEPSISSKLAEHMGRYFTGWDVDCEYNRLGKTARRKLIDYSKKKFLEAKSSGIIPSHITTLEELEKSSLGVSVFPDIIVHHRGHIFENLLIVEVKKANNPDVGLGWDEFKIDFFIEILHYKAGAFIVFNTEPKEIQAQHYVNNIRWFP